MQLRVQRQATIEYNRITGAWVVNYGIFQTKVGTMLECEQWCKARKIAIRNQDELDRVKAGMPISEMWR